MRALVLNCTLKPSPEPSNTQALADEVIAALRGHGVDVEVVRLADHHIPPGIKTDMGEGDEWPRIHRILSGCRILIFATPTWMGQPSSIAKKALERMDAMMTETRDDGTPVAYSKVAGVVVTGNEDGAHHVISQISGPLVDLGFTIPGQSWTYWNMGPGPGPSYTETDHKHDWSARTGRTMAANLVAAATALEAHPLPTPG
ncbi:multimeric flavodoxin WrbA [Stackebrandtia albiflava]|uniref:Multimeric flavodoxin WrbA n=1 Tax=Stackebrandtia albiflava TaxID=406432 RepID=A0A562V9L7_9ACTN|nr:flavodoxin family protein [Stackebrandtia albiflava]TWJ14552.1 multimeric flavodoxin WrbA [Stackebrandtia albiflava]